MPRSSRLFTCVAAAALLALGMPATHADNNHSAHSSCGAKTKGPYGFQCHGYAAVSAAGLEPVTFVGTVEGSNAGVFRGLGTFNSSLGSARQRVIGTADFQDRTCAGHIRYDVFLILPGGVEVPLPPLDIDFVTVDGGREVLGTPNSPAGTGAAVPRMSCRLVKIH